MRHVFIIAYDISDPKRYRQLYKSMKGAGDSLQYSVFRCELSAVELQELKMKVWPVLNLEEDRVMIVNLGLVEGRGDECIEFWGNPRSEPPDRNAVIL
ncbi:MAG: CRISPR-associated endonuclease Cas2 [Planctomycetota bacterium]|nr:MAG: CRISPR-associated endonuclease Cas2 [Planctomycetota bacterium]